MGLIALLSLVNVSPVLASGEYQAQSLRGIKEFAVLIEDLKPEIEKEGLTRNIIQTDVELKLRLAGIKVITEEESFKVPGAPYLYVNVNVMKLKTIGYVFHINVEFRQSVNLLRKYRIEYGVPTWFRGVLGGTSYSSNGAFQKIRGAVKDMVDEFINGYLSVNPK